MNREEVMGVFSMLAGSQGFYGRLIRDIEAREDAGEDMSDFFGQFANCRDAVDVIMIVEG